MAFPQLRLRFGLVTLSQYASLFLAVSYAPNWQINQLAMVATRAGKNNLKLRLKLETAKFDSAVSTCPDLASFTGFNEFTNPERMIKQATHAGPWPTSRKMGRCIMWEGPFSLMLGATM